MRAQPGELLKSPTAGNSTLVPTPQFRRLTEHLRDLITIAYERSTRRRCKSLNLVRLEYASDENNGGRYSMHFAALVREPDHDECVPLQVSITVNTEHEL